MLKFRTHNPKVVGSNPAPATSFYKALKAIMSLRPFWFLGRCSGSSLAAWLLYLLIQTISPTQRH